MISIIVPIYNAERFLRQCINSILDQDYTVFEIILVNDGSKDASLDICYSYDDHRIVVINQKNGGVSSARNAGLEVAKGEYVTFVDSDDTLPVNALSLLVKGMKDNFVDMVIGSFMFQHGDIYRSHSSRLAKGLYSFSSLLSGFIDDGTLSGFLFGSVCGTLYRKDIIEQYQLHFNPEVKNNEDGLFNFEYALKTKSVYVLSECVYYYRQYNTSSSSLRKITYNFNTLIKNYVAKLDWDKDKYNFEVQFKRRNVSIALWDILKYPPKMQLKDGIKFIRQLLRQTEFRNGISEIDVSHLTFYKKIFFYLMKWRCSFVLYILVKLILPIVNSRISR